MLLLKQALSLIRASETAYYVYVLVDENGLPFYVGKGTGTRIVAHETEAADLTCSSFEQWEVDAEGVIEGKELAFRYTAPKHQEIRRIWDLGVKVRYQLPFFHDEETEAHAEEKRLIKLHGRRDRGTGMLTNLSDGGEGQSWQYPEEQWEVDAEGVIIGKEVVSPTAAQLAAPRFRRPDLHLEKDQAVIKQEYVKPTGPEMPRLAFWQDAGWTVQIFWEESYSVKTATLPAYCVLFRFFEGAQLMLQDSIDIPSQELTCPGLMVARIMRAIANPNVTGRHIRICRRCANVDYTKRLRAWCAHRRESLHRLAEVVEAVFYQPVRWPAPFEDANPGVLPTFEPMSASWRPPPTNAGYQQSFGDTFSKPAGNFTPDVSVNFVPGPTDAGAALESQPVMRDTPIVVSNLGELPTGGQASLTTNTVRIEREGIYNDHLLTESLGVSTETLARARDEGRLRYARKGDRILYMGQWVLDWLSSAGFEQLFT
jgi:hypothetical protein